MSNTPRLLLHDVGTPEDGGSCDFPPLPARCADGLVASLRFSYSAHGRSADGKIYPRAGFRLIRVRTDFNLHRTFFLTVPMRT